MSWLVSWLRVWLAVVRDDLWLKGEWGGDVSMNLGCEHDRAAGSVTSIHPRLLLSFPTDYLSTISICRWSSSTLLTLNLYSNRSPWSNDYDPPLEDGTVPSIKLRKLEIAANEAFDTYREMYYEGGVSSVYLWDLDEGGFAGVVLLKKSTSFVHS